MRTGELGTAEVRSGRSTTRPTTHGAAEPGTLITTDDRPLLGLAGLRFGSHIVCVNNLSAAGPLRAMRVAHRGHAVAANEQDLGLGRRAAAVWKPRKRVFPKQDLARARAGCSTHAQT
jgi:hypothetical protein